MAERPYICNFPGCTKKFGRNDQLQRHIKTHSKPKKKSSSSSSISSKSSITATTTTTSATGNANSNITGTC